MGIVINLIEAWEPFKAARSALANTLESSNIKDHAMKYASRLQVNNLSALLKNQKFVMQLKCNFYCVESVTSDSSTFTRRSSH